MDEKLPLSIEIEINSDCNLSCSYCPNAKSERTEKGHMAPQTYELIMKQLSAYDYAGRISYHFYNEPTLSPNLLLFLEMTKSYLPKTKRVMYSNGTNLNEKNLNEYYSAGLSKFIVTEHHQTKLNNLDFISNDKSLENTDKFKFSSFKEIPFTNRGGTLKVGPKISAPLKTPCLIPKCVMVITLKGNVVACYEDYFQKHVMGNILENDILTIWKSEKYVHFRNELKKGNRENFEVCRSCNNQLIIV